jgi:hypothetical protein
MKGIKDSKTGRFIKNLEDKKCLTCKKNFHPRFSKIKYCCHECAMQPKKKDRNRNCVKCGNKFFAVSLKTRFCSQECYSASGLRAKRGSENHLWKGGITPINTMIRASTKYKNWIKIILKRDDYTCQFCKSHGVKFHIDHIIPFSAIIEKLKFEQGIENLFEKAMNYNLLWEITNGRTLCIACHKKTDTYLNYNAKKYV